MHQPLTRRVIQISKTLSLCLKEEAFSSSHYLVSHTTDNQMISVKCFLYLPPLMKMEATLEELHAALDKISNFKEWRAYNDSSLFPLPFTVIPNVLILKFDWLQEENVKDKDFSSKILHWARKLSGDKILRVSYFEGVELKATFIDKTNSIAFWKALNYVLFNNHIITARAFVKPRALPSSIKRSKYNTRKSYTKLSRKAGYSPRSKSTNLSLDTFPTLSQICLLKNKKTSIK